MKERKIRILICDDQTVVCDGLEAILSTIEDMHVVGMAYNGEEALALCESLQPDLVLMDLKMPVMNGIQATRRIARDFPAIRVLVLTTYDDDEWLFDAIRAGAHGYLLKNTPREELVTAIRNTVTGKTPVDPGVAGRLFSHLQGQTAPTDTMLTDDLSTREKEVLHLLGKGFTNLEIAETLHLSEGTVKNIVSRVLAKLDLKDRTQAAIFAVRMGLMPE